MSDQTVTPQAPSRLARTLRGIGPRQVRLVSGLVLFVYIVSHFVNHALGNISTDAMDVLLKYQMLFWRSWPAALVLYGAALVHTALGIWALYERRHFRWTAWEATQLVLGLSIPALILSHLVGVRLAATLYGHDKLYEQVFFGYWVARPYMAAVQYTVMVVSWTHGCIGLFFWLRMKSWFRRAAPFLLAVAVLLPAVAMLGLYQGGRAIVDLSDDADWRIQNLTRSHVGTPRQQMTLDDIIDSSLIGYIALLGITLAARGVRTLAERRRGLIRLTNVEGRTIRVPRGLSVLEANLRYGIPHSSVCGGRARCSTCRIRIVGDHGALPEPSMRETFVLNRVGVRGDPAVRLACQLRPDCDLSYVAMFPPQLSGATLRSGLRVHAGQERYLVSMFVDMRGSTKLAEKRLPFDTVFIINRFLTAVSQAVVAAGGRPNQFVGDGQLALFGLDCAPREACRQAIRAAALIATNVDQLNAFLKSDLPEPIRFGIGINGGEVIIGDLGSPGHAVFTALGDPVNVAARLQDMSKGFACEAVISQEVFDTGGLSPDALPSTQVDIRGRVEPMTVRTAERAATLAAIVATDQPDPTLVAATLATPALAP
jgi:adenylate cyclase